MKLIVGLGNPGRVYINSRHNIGFLVLNALAKSRGVIFKKETSAYALTAKVKIAGKDLILAQPQTYMNLSGYSVKALLGKYKVNVDNLLVVCDDLDLELGRIKIKDSGSSGGHRGLKSIIDTLKSNSFNRLRIGIGRFDKLTTGRPEIADLDAAAYVLSAFTKKEEKIISSIKDRACECIEVWAAQGITQAMNMFNKRKQN